MQLQQSWVDRLIRETTAADERRLRSLTEAELREQLRQPALEFRSLQRTLMATACCYLYDELDVFAIYEELLMAQSELLLTESAEG